MEKKIEAGFNKATATCDITSEGVKMHWRRVNLIGGGRMKRYQIGGGEME